MGEGDVASIHLLDFRKPQLNAGKVSGYGDSLLALWELTVSENHCFLSDSGT